MDDLNLKLSKCAYLLGLAHGGICMTIEQLSQEPTTNVLDGLVELKNRLSSGIDDTFYKPFEEEDEKC